MDHGEIAERLRSSRLLKDAAPETLARIAKTCPVRDFPKGEDVLKDAAPALYVLLRGRVTVRGNNATLNTLKAGDCFGAAGLFGGTGSVTSVTAAEKCSAVLIDQQTVETLLRRDFAFAKGYIVFLSDRIRFLNRKIASFTTDGSEKKLANYLLSLPHEGDAVTLPVNLSRLASQLNISRASLYRAFDALDKSFGITRRKNTVFISPYEEFEKIYQ